MAKKKKMSAYEAIKSGKTKFKEPKFMSTKAYQRAKYNKKK